MEEGGSIFNGDNFFVDGVVDAYGVRLLAKKERKRFRLV